MHGLECLQFDLRQKENAGRTRRKPLRRGLDRGGQLASLATRLWIRSAQNLSIHGATVAGKACLACAFAQQACRQGLSALYLPVPRLFDELSLCHADGSLRKRLASIAKVQTQEVRPHVTPM